MQKTLLQVCYTTLTCRIPVQQLSNPRNFRLPYSSNSGPDCLHINRPLVKPQNEHYPFNFFRSTFYVCLEIFNTVCHFAFFSTLPTE